MVQDGQVIIVDEFTGRLMPGRRWSDGLHQAVEAHEGVKIERETQTLASITFQNYFRMYKKLAGMTGTADTEAAEFGKIYNLEVTVIPTNRADDPQWKIRTSSIAPKKKSSATRPKKSRHSHEKGQPVLVGTISVEKSERLSAILKKMGVRHEVLNAKNHEREAHIVAQAGRKGAVTVSTNMAGRGTDILLGGNPDFLLEDHLRKDGQDPGHASPEELERNSERGQGARSRLNARGSRRAGGLHILGTERHESRRIDNQLRGRAGRQGDPGQLAFLSFSARRFAAHLRRRAHAESDAASRHGRGRADRVETDHQAHRGRAKSRRSAAFRLAQTRPRIRRRNEQAAPGRVWHAAAIARRREPERANRGHRRGIVGGFIDQFCPENARSDQYDLPGLQTDVSERSSASKLDIDELERR